MADLFDLRRDIQFNMRVKAASFDEASGCWAIETSDGGRTTATYCIMALGCLSSPNLPSFQGLETFQGEHPMDFPGRFYRHTLLHPMFNPGPIEHPRIPIGLGGVGPQLTALAGELGDLYLLQSRPITTL